MLEILRATSTPVGAVSTTVYTQLAELQMTYATFLTIDASLQDIVSNTPITGAHTAVDAMKTNIKELEGKDWPSKLTKASRELTKVCMYTHTIPLPLLLHAKTRARSSTTLISQYETVLHNLHLLWGSKGIMMNHMVQSQDQTVSIMKSFSSADYITFLPWKKESLAILGNSGILKEFWAQIILQCILPPKSQPPPEPPTMWIAFLLTYNAIMLTCM